MMRLVSRLSRRAAAPVRVTVAASSVRRALPVRTALGRAAAAAAAFGACGTALALADAKPSTGAGAGAGASNAAGAVATTDIKTTARGNPMKGGCPVPHEKRAAAAAAMAAAGAGAAAAAPPHPIPHTASAAAPAVSAAAKAAPAPVAVAAPAAAQAPAPAPVAPAAATDRGVPDTDDRELHVPSLGGAHHTLKVEKAAGDEGDYVPESAIPAAGRGNSDDGKTWLNPSANQLYRALARKHKPIDGADAPAVAQVHEMVTNGTWAAIMEYEALHAGECKAGPVLDRFQGMDGIYSAKAKVVKVITGAVPFDRHDWYVNRCGKEIKYIIDYYEIPEAHGQVAYTVDARPAPTPAGLYDRARLAFRKWRAGESFW